MNHVGHQVKLLTCALTSASTMLAQLVWLHFKSGRRLAQIIKSPSYLCLIPHATPHTNANTNTNTNTNMYGNTQIVKSILSSSDTTVYTSYLHQCQVQLTHWVFVQKNLSMEMFIIDLINSSYFHPFTIIESNMIILFSWFN